VAPDFTKLISAGATPQFIALPHNLQLDIRRLTSKEREEREGKEMETKGKSR